MSFSSKPRSGVHRRGQDSHIVIVVVVVVVIVIVSCCYFIVVVVMVTRLWASARSKVCPVNSVSILAISGSLPAQ